MRVAILDLDAIPPCKREPKKADTSKPRKTADWRRICRSLRHDGPQTVRALALNLNLSVETVRFHIQFYVRRGVMDRVGRKYRLTDLRPNGWARDFWGYRPRDPRPPRPPKLVKLTAWDRILQDHDVLDDEVEPRTRPPSNGE